MANIFELLAKLKDFDESVHELSLEDHKDLLTDTQKKIDAYGDLLGRLEAEHDRLIDHSSGILARANILAGEIKRINSYLLAACKVNNITEFKGERYKLKYLTSTRIRPKEEATYESLQRYPGFVEKKVAVTFAWDRKALEAAFKAADPKALEAAESYKTETVKFRV